MDVIQIHKALTTIWPGGIPREGFVALAGMIKALVDKNATTSGNSPMSMQTKMEQALAIARIPDSEPPTKTQKRGARSAPPKVLVRIKSYLRSVGAKTQADIAKNLKLGLWTVKRAIWQLQREGEITRHETVQGPHLYQIAPTLPLGL
jgi:hypothetical protein